MMDSSKHTPTPWRTNGTGLGIKAEINGILVATVEGPDRRARGKEWAEDHEYCHGNAAFIVRAVNSHDQLVTALRKIAEITKPQMCMDGNAKVGAPNSTGYDFQLIARAALAAVGA